MSARCCSEACAVFFIRDTAPVEKQPRRRGRSLYAAFGRKALPDLSKGDVRHLLDEPQNEGLVRIELRMRRLALLARLGLAGLAIATIPLPAVEIPMLKRRAASRVETLPSIGATTRPRRSPLRLLVIFTSSQTTHSSEPDKAVRVNSQIDSVFIKDALASFLFAKTIMPLLRQRPDRARMEIT